MNRSPLSNLAWISSASGCSSGLNGDTSTLCVPVTSIRLNLKLWPLSLSLRSELSIVPAIKARLILAPSLVTMNPGSYSPDPCSGSVASLYSCAKTRMADCLPTLIGFENVRGPPPISRSRTQRFQQDLSPPLRGSQLGSYIHGHRLSIVHSQSLDDQETFLLILT